MRRSPSLVAALAAGALAVGALGATSCSTGTERQASADEPLPEIVRIAVLDAVEIDPLAVRATDAPAVLAADLLFDGLTSSDGATVEPELAASWETSDAVTWTFRLDPERRASDGSEITAERVVASLERVRASSGTSLAAARFGIVSSVSAVDASTVQIVLATADRELPAMLADPAYGIVPEVRNAPTMASTTVTSGPFRVRSGGPAGATLVPNGADATSEVTVEGVQFVRVEDEAAAIEAFEAGDVDIVPIPDDADVPAGAQVVVPEAATLVLEMTGGAPFGDVANRTAVAAAVDRSALAEVETGDAGRAAGSIVPGTTGSGERGNGAESAAGEGSLAALGATAGTVTVDVPDGVVDEAGAAELVRQLTSAGLTAEVRRSDAAGLAARMAAGEARMVLFAVVGTAPTPDPYLAAVFGSAGGENLSGRGTNAWDAALAVARANPDDTARRAAYEELERTALADGTVVPLVRVGQRYAVAERVTGVAAVGARLFDGTVVGLR